MGEGRENAHRVKRVFYSDLCNLNFNNLINTFETGYLMYTVTSNDGGCNVAKTSIPYVITEPSTRLICSNTILTGDVHTYTITIEYVKFQVFLLCFLKNSLFFLKSLHPPNRTNSSEFHSA